MNVLLLAQNYPPDLGAGAFRMQGLVNILLSEGHHVSVLTGSMNRYGSFESFRTSSERETPSREKIYRIPSLKDNGSILKRGVGYSLFFMESLPRTIKLARQHDVIFATSPQLLVGFLGGLAAKITGKPFILDIRDLWPDVMLDMGVLASYSPTYKILKRIELFLYKQADRIIVNSPAFIDHVIRSGGKELSLITNGLDDIFFRNIANLPVVKEKNPYILTYAGNIGVAQNLMPILEVAHKFKGKLIFRFIGDGSDKERLMKYAQENSLNNIRFISPVSREKLINYYASTNAFMVHLKDIPMFSKTIPSKIFEYVATGKPVVYGLNGVAADLMYSLQGDLLRFTPDDSASLESSLTTLVDVIEKRVQWYGQRGINEIRKCYLRKNLSRKLAQVITTSGEEFASDPVRQGA